NLAAARWQRIHLSGHAERIESPAGDRQELRSAADVPGKRAYRVRGVNRVRDSVIPSVIRKAGVLAVEQERCLRKQFRMLRQPFARLPAAVVMPRTSDEDDRALALRFGNLCEILREPNHGGHTSCIAL